MTLPIGREDDFVGVVDVLTKSLCRDDSGLPENYEVVDVPADMVDDVELSTAIEAAVEMDDDLMMEYMEGEMPSIEDVKRYPRRHAHHALLPNILRKRI